MIETYIVSMGVVFALFAGWVLVQRASRVFAARHPEFGPAREEGGGCGAACTCSMSGRCRRELDAPTPDQPVHCQEKLP